MQALVVLDFRRWGEQNNRRSRITRLHTAREMSSQYLGDEKLRRGNTTFTGKISSVASMPGLRSRGRARECDSCLLPCFTYMLCVWIEQTRTLKCFFDQRVVQACVSVCAQRSRLHHHELLLAEAKGGFNQTLLKYLLPCEANKQQFNNRGDFSNI